MLYHLLTCNYYYSNHNDKLYISHNIPADIVKQRLGNIINEWTSNVANNYFWIKHDADRLILVEEVGISLKMLQ